MKRQGISKKLRFEVYKRDKFTCQYCGRKAPDVILEIDHITPVAKEGDNNILNLVTSCYDCNRGKSDNLLSENSVLEKQRQQMELLQEKREQIEMLFEWRKSLDNLRNYSDDLLIEYIESKIIPYTLTENCKKRLVKLFHKADINNVFTAIDKGESLYLKYDNNSKLLQDSVETFLGKIGGMITMDKKSPIEKKIHYIKGICRNRFHYCDDQKCIIILMEYVKALQKVGWKESDIMEDLETEASDWAKTSQNWSEWKQRMEGWIQSIKEWPETNKKEKVNRELQIDEIQQIALQMRQRIMRILELIRFISTPFGEINEKDLFIKILESIQKYIKEQSNELCKEKEDKEDIELLEPDFHICQDMNLFDFMEEFDSPLKSAISEMFSFYATKWAQKELYLPNLGIEKSKDAILLEQYFNNEMKDFIENIKILKEDCEIADNPTL